MDPLSLVDQLRKEHVVYSWGKPLVLVSILLYETNIKVVSYPLDHHISGLLQNYKGCWIICVNSNHAASDWHFAIAHLLYRYYAHRHLQHKFICRHLPTNLSKPELDANKFATKLLTQATAHAQMKVAEQAKEYISHRQSE